MSKSRSPSRRKKDQPQMSIQVILSRWGLEPYFPYFEKAGFKFMEPGTQRLTDQNVELMIVRVENVCGVAFMPEIRTLLWKALRHQWFKGPGHDITFISKSDIPKIFLPKPDYKQVDSMIPFGELEGDRQRQVIRKVRKKQQTSVKGPTLETLQFENYKRDNHMWYEFKDIQRCVGEWQRKNPRTMVREDPREEVLKMRIRGAMEVASAELMARREELKKKRAIGRLLGFIRGVSFLMMTIMLYIAYARYERSPRELMLQFAVASGQFRAGIAFMVCFWFSHTVLGRAHADPKIAKLRRMLLSLERLAEQISDFRVETEDLRMFDAEARGAELEFQAAEARRAEKQGNAFSAQHLFERRQRKKEKKADKAKDAVQMWAGKEEAKKKLDLAELNKMLDESRKRLPDLPPNFQRPGGHRHARGQYFDQEALDEMKNNPNPSQEPEDGKKKYARSLIRPASEQYSRLKNQDEVYCYRATPGNKQSLLGLEGPPSDPAIFDGEPSPGSRTHSRAGSAGSGSLHRSGSRDMARAGSPHRTASRDIVRAGSPHRTASRDIAAAGSLELAGLAAVPEFPAPGEEPKPAPKRRGETRRRASRDPGCLPEPSSPPRQPLSMRLASRDSGLGSPRPAPPALASRLGSRDLTGEEFRNRKASRTVRITDEPEQADGPVHEPPMGRLASRDLYAPALVGSRLGTPDPQGFASSDMSDIADAHFPELPPPVASADAIPELPELEPPASGWDEESDDDRVLRAVADSDDEPPPPQASPPSGQDPPLPGSMP